MRVPAWTQHNWHDICCPATARKMSRTTSRLILGLRWSDIGIWYSQPRPSLDILRKFVCPPTFIAIVRQFHTGMCAQVVMAGSQSSSFLVEVGVKQDCVLAPNIFNLLLVAITLVSHRDLQSSDCVGIVYRLDGGLFSLRRLQAKTKTSSAIISAIQCADDAAFPSHTADGLQRSLDVMSETYLRAGLVINTTKQKSLVQHHLIPQLFLLVGISLRILKILLTWAKISHFLVTS